MKKYCHLALALVWAQTLANTSTDALAAPTPNGKAEHILVVVWDGMRPDFVTPQYCPTLYSLATNGTFFRRNHSAFISTTEVNGTALATGANPGRNGIQANADFRPELSFLSTTPPRDWTPSVVAIWSRAAITS